MGNFDLEIVTSRMGGKWICTIKGIFQMLSFRAVTQERRTPATFAVLHRCAISSLGLRFARPRCRRSARFPPLQVDALRAQVSAFIYMIASSLAWAQARETRKRTAALATLKALASSSLLYFQRHTAGYLAGWVGWETPLGKTPPASEAVATRRAPLPSQTPNAVRRCSVYSVALSRADGATFVDAERSEALRSLWGVRFDDHPRPSSRRRKNAAPLPLAGVPCLAPCKERKTGARNPLGSGDALRGSLRSQAPKKPLRAQGSSVINHYWFWLRSGRHAHTPLSLPPGSCKERRSPAVADRLAAALRNNLHEQVVEMGEKKRCQVAIFSTSRSNSTRQAAGSARKRPPATCPQFLMRVAFYCFKFQFRDGITPPHTRNLPATMLWQAFNGAEERAYSCNNISLLKAWRVSAPQPPRFAAACRSRQHGHPRQGGFQPHLRGVLPSRGAGRFGIRYRSIEWRCMN